MKITNLFRCPNCKCALKEGDSNPSLQCMQCKASFPVQADRFPDFLSDAERTALDQEIAYWKEHFSGQDYQDESEKSYQIWKTYLDTKATDTILEIGCGSGALLKRLPGAILVGLEPAASLLETSQGFQGVISLAENLPFNDDTFDVTFFKHSLHHVKDKHAAFKEAIRVTKPGGKIAVIEPNASHPYRKLVSNPESFFRKHRFIFKIMSPVETFQKADEIQKWGEEKNLTISALSFHESDYEKLSLLQLLQKIYRMISLPFLPKKFRYPNYLVIFRKPHGSH